MEVFTSINEFAKSLSVPGIAILLLFGLWKEWWFLAGAVKRDREECEDTVKVLKATTAELTETKIVYAALQARYEALESKPRRGAAS